jgi:hypothetical protein
MTHGYTTFTSPAIDKGSNPNALLNDQRGSARTFDDPSIANAGGGDGTDIGAFEQLPPSAAEVSVSGRVTTANGQGVRNVRVSLTDSEGNVRHAMSGSFGYYRFDEIEAGQTVILGVASKRYVFTNPTRILMVVDDIADADFVADE